MIGKSDLIILLVSASALAGGIYRWQSNTGAVPAITVPATGRIAESGSDLLANTNTNQPSTATISTDATPAPRVVSEATAPTDIVFESDTSASSGSSASTDTALVANAGNNEAQSLFGTHRVQAGDYLGLIATRYGTSVDALMEINALQDNIIQIDQEIRYPLPAN